MAASPSAKRRRPPRRAARPQQPVLRATAPAAAKPTSLRLGGATSLCIHVLLCAQMQAWPRRTSLSHSLEPLLR